MAVETKNSFRSRMLRDGTWGEAMSYRKALMADGMSEDSAHERTVEAYPAEVPKEEAPADGGQTDLRRDVLWVYRNLNNVMPKGAPSGGATRMHRWGRENEREFFRMLEKYVGAEKEKEKEPEAGLLDRSTELAERWLEEYGKLSVDSNAPRMGPSGAGRADTEVVGGEQPVAAGLVEEVPGGPGVSGVDSGVVREGPAVLGECVLRDLRSAEESEDHTVCDVALSGQGARGDSGSDPERGGLVDR